MQAIISFDDRSQAAQAQDLLATHFGAHHSTQEGAYRYGSGASIRLHQEGDAAPFGKHKTLTDGCLTVKLPSHTLTAIQSRLLAAGLSGWVVAKT